MTRLERIEAHGYKVTFDMSGRSVFAIKGSEKIKATSVTALHKRIFGY